MVIGLCDLKASISISAAIGQGPVVELGLIVLQNEEMICLNPDMEWK